MFSKTVLKQQVKLLYLLIPTIVYLLLFSLNVQIQKHIFRRQDATCTNKNGIIRIDESLFENLIYNSMNQSMNLPFLIILAIPYLAHFLIPAIYILYIFIKQKGWKTFWQYLVCLSLTSLIAVLIQNSYPTPPPWIFLNLPPQAKFIMVDQNLHIKIFTFIYNANALVCGAFPSLHVGWPTVLAMVGGINKYTGFLYVIWISIAAFYSAHHWITDVIIGIILAIVFSLIGKLIIRKLVIDQNQKNKTTGQNKQNSDDIAIQIQDPLIEKKEKLIDKYEPNQKIIRT